MREGCAADSLKIVFNHYIMIKCLVSSFLCAFPRSLRLCIQLFATVENRKFLESDSPVKADFKRSLYRNNLKNRFLTASAWQQLFDLHSRLALKQCRSIQAQIFAPLPSHIPNSSNHFGAKKKWVWNLVCGLLALIAFAIPIEHKYDKPFRIFSKSLIPEGLLLPSWFDKKIYFYPSDLIALSLILIALFILKVPLRKLFVQKGSSLLWLLIALIAVSIATSPLSNYALLYFRLWQWITGAFLFGLLASIDESHRTTAAKWILVSLIAMGVFQSLLTIAQYFHQGCFGLRLIGETTFSRETPGCPTIGCPQGSRWIVDKWMGLDFHTNAVIRPMGTTPHPNVLGGFLALGGLASLSFFCLSPRKWIWCGLISLQFFALVLTYSRGALFSYLIGTAIWFTSNWITNNRKGLLKGVMLVGSISLIALFFLREQLAWRGGVFGSSTSSQETHALRENLENLAMKMIEKSPLFGVGFQQFSLRAPEFTGLEAAHHMNGAHNIYLLLGAESGIAALLCFLAFAGSIFLRVMRKKPSPYFGSLLAMFIALLLIGARDFYPLLFQMGKLLFFITAGLLT